MPLHWRLCEKSGSRPWPYLLAALAVAFHLVTLSHAAGKSFDEDVAFLAKHNEVVVLSDDSGKAQVAVVPAYQGRVMTSTASGGGGDSFGWINYDLIAAGKLQPHINTFGGEERFWLGPEGGQFSIFFKKGDPFDLEHWQTPAVIDTDHYKVVAQSKRHVAFRHRTLLSNYSGTRFDLQIDRTVKLLRPSDSHKLLGVKAGRSLKMVAYETENKLTNMGREAWTKDTGLLSIWILGMYKPSPQTTVVLPYREGSENALGPVVNDSYFGKVPADRLRVRDGVIYFCGDGQYRSKIGLTPQRAKPVAGSYDTARRVLTLVQYNQPEGVTDYVNSMWQIQKEPFRGDAVNSYNDGPPAPGAKPLGPFYELETSSPAAALKPGASLTHVSRTYHFQGEEKALDAIARHVLTVGLENIKAAFQ